MFPPPVGAVAAAAALLLAAAARASAPPQLADSAPRPAAPEPQARPAVEDETALALTRVLDSALDGGWRDLHIETECATGAGFLAAEVFDSGVGIWNRQTQFELSRTDLRALLQAFRETGFPGMRESYGGRKDPVLRQNQPPRATCRVSLRLEGVRKQVAQLHLGRQSEELKRLAGRILEICEGPARSGQGASSLADGLAKVTAGALAAETFQVLVHRKEEGSDSHQGRESWLLRVEGRRASTQRPSAEKGYADPIVLELSREDLAGLARLLRDAGLQELPFNLYAEHYTELVVSVLNWRKALQARPFSGMTRATHGGKQKRFDEIYGRLRDLERRVGAEGRSPSSPPPAPPGAHGTPEELPAVW